MDFSRCMISLDVQGILQATSRTCKIRFTVGLSPDEKTLCLFHTILWAQLSQKVSWDMCHPLGEHGILRALSCVCKVHSIMGHCPVQGLLVSSYPSAGTTLPKEHVFQNVFHPLGAHGNLQAVTRVCKVHFTVGCCLGRRLFVFFWKKFYSQIKFYWHALGHSYI